MIHKTLMAKPVYALAAIVIVIAIIGVIYVAIGSASAETVATGDTVGVYYTGTLTNGTVFDSNVGKEPLTFTVGSGQVIQGFDQAVIGMKINESKTVTLPENEAYGPVNPKLIVVVPLSVFGNETVTKGMTVSNGQAQGTVTQVNATNATVDFNPPLAGQTLIFKITIATIQKK